ncbi:LysM peptidoglycan-binding domain-containing protein [Gangjinia marincola]|uniref:LysM peptidoglycan-binding domain-containing protein n=1 Tax=Gangjinia marincola TaxID=578463 RepID=A0ABN1MFX8_9FLAO
MRSITIICFLILSWSIQAQEYKAHKVQEGETLESIAARYGTSVAAIKKINPDAANLTKNSILVVADYSGMQPDPVDFVMHKVKRKETLFSLSQRYNVSQTLIKKYNKQLYAEKLRKGDRIQIPVYPKPGEVVERPGLPVIDPMDDKIATHVVQMSEGKFGIARKYGISVAQLNAMNPGVGDDLKPGQKLIVTKNPTDKASILKDRRFAFYEVQPLENFFQLTQKFEITQDSLIALNPSLTDGVKAGMVLKVPNNELSAVGFFFTDNPMVNLEDSLTNNLVKELVVMLPFNLDRSSKDSVNLEDRFKRERLLNLSLDFYEGVLMALDSAKRNGISVNLQTFDTQQDSSKVANLFKANDFSNVQAIIGPLMNTTFDVAARQAEALQIPVFSPLTTATIGMTPNVFQTRTIDSLMEVKLMNHLDDRTETKNVIIIADSSAEAKKERLLTKYPVAKVITPRENSFIYQTDLSKELVDGMENWIFIETNQVSLISNVTSYLNALSDKYKAQLFTTGYNSSFENENIDANHLSKLRFMFASISKQVLDNKTGSFNAAYLKRFGKMPSQYALRGFDITYDVLLRLAAFGDVYSSAHSGANTSYLKSGFYYAKQPMGGYYNTSAYLIQYEDGLQLKLVE